MNPAWLKDFASSPSGRLLGFGLVVGGALALYGHFRGRVELPTLVPSTSRTNEKPQLVETVTHPMDLFRPPAPRPDSVKPGVTQPPPGPVPVIVTNPAPSVTPAALAELPLSLVPDATAGKAPAKVHSDVYAPYGRLIPAETVITVDSSSIQTPIIGLITEDIFHAGRLVIPAGTELHGTAQVDHSRERIASGTAWTLVWQSGEELHLKGIALDREFASTSNHVGWGITDGSAGLRGRLLKTDDLAEVKMFAATFLAGAAKALTEKQPTLLGSVDAPSLNNAPLKGAEDVLGTYAERIRESIQRDGFYIRVPSGKQFYLYVLQAIDRADARLPGDIESENTP